MKNVRFKYASFSSIIIILVLTVLEFPAPIGFETRPQDNVSLFWLVFFLTILIIQITALPLLIKKPRLGSIFGITAGILNILQVVADQLHLMQPEVAPIGYTLLEYGVAIVSAGLIYCSVNLMKAQEIRASN